MARKDRQSIIAAPPPAGTSSSSSSKSDSDSDNKSSSSSSSGDYKHPQPLHPHKKPQVPDSDSDSDPTPKSNHTSFPITHVTALTAVTSKRKNTDPTNEGSAKKPMFKRVWSEDDEIVILKGMIEFKAKMGKDPMSDIDDFVGFVKSSLHVVDVKKEQIVGKIRRIKSRFLNSKKRTLNNPHEVDVFELSKRIWGGSYDGNWVSLKGCSSKSKSKDLKDGVDGVALIDTEKMVEVGDERMGINKFGDVDEKFMNEGFKLLSEDERVELEEEWRAFNVTQMEGLVKRFELYKKTAKTLLNAVKSAKH